MNTIIQSMTGFASETTTFTLQDGTKVDASISIKTLNSRHFESSCKLSYVISFLETKIIKLLKKNLFRGSAYVTLYLRNTQSLQDSVEPALATVKNYHNAIEKIKKEVPISGNLQVGDLFRMPDIFITQEKDLDEHFEKQVLSKFEELIKKLIETRHQEGQSLKDDLSQRISVMQKEIDLIEKNAAILMEKKKKEVAELLKKIEAEENTEKPDARKNSLYASLDKIDVHEEIVRFKSHLKNLSMQLDSTIIEKGKRLDFTLQELAREINTLTSKCSDADLSTQAINIKVELEKAREQAQNIV